MIRYVENDAVIAQRWLARRASLVGHLRRSSVLKVAWKTVFHTCMNRACLTALWDGWCARGSNASTAR